MTALNIHPNILFVIAASNHQVDGNAKCVYVIKSGAGIDAPSVANKDVANYFSTFISATFNLPLRQMSRMSLIPERLI